jgi:cupin fold WbuC family metalloprotein
MLNAMEPGTYIRPHRHSAPPKAESLVLLRGRLGIVVFDEHGALIDEDSCELSPDGSTLGVDLRAGVWHTMLALEPGTVIFEVKPGPYERAADKDFASWAPREDTPAAAEYLRELERRFRCRRTAAEP